ncbi:LolA family protein [Haloarcula salina]|uniref:LolA family protein n=1 Tax=Haloarcula salina TaxID=1429914 RepID=UPI003C702596
MASRHLTTERLVLTLATVVVVSVLAAAAWSVAVPSATATPRPTVDADVATQYDAIDGVEATQTTTITRNGSVSSRTVYDATLRPGTGKQRLEVRSSTAERYDLRVSNGSTLWLYDRDRGNATRISLSGASYDQGARLERLLARLNMTDTDTRPRTVEPLPVVPHGGRQPADAAVASGTRMGVSYRGTETVDGREAYVVHVSPENGSAAYEQTLWLDSERFFPLKQRTEWTANGRSTVVTTTYENVSYDTGVGDDAFVPDFPANTTVTAPETPETRTYRTVDALEADTDVRVPAVDLPPSFELAYATQTRGRIHGVGLSYVNRTSRITVAKYNFTYRAPEGDEQVTIDGRTASLSRGLTSSLSWNCGEYRYTIRGQGVAADRLVAIGQSVGCPASG